MSSYRGSYRGSWRGRGRGSQTASQPTPPSKPLGPVVNNIDIKALLIEEDSPVITDVEYVASYNWLDVKSPVILVPGKFISHLERKLRHIEISDIFKTEDN